VSTDQPRGVVAVDEAGDGLAQLVDGVVQLRPQALLLEGTDPALGAAVGLRLTEEGGVVADPQPADRAEEVGRAVLGSQSWRSATPRATSAPRPPKRSMTAS